MFTMPDGCVMCNTLQSPVMDETISLQNNVPLYLDIPLQCQMIDNEQKNITYLNYIAIIYLMMRKGVMFHEQYDSTV